MDKRPDRGGPIALPAAECEAVFERAAETGARRALHEVGLDLAELHRLARAFAELVVVNLEPENLELLVDRSDLAVAALVKAIRALLAPTATPQRPEAHILAFARPPADTASNGAEGAPDAHLRRLVAWVATVLAARLAASSSGPAPGETAVPGWDLSGERALALLCPEGEPASPAEAERRLRRPDPRRRDRRLFPTSHFRRRLTPCRTPQWTFLPLAGVGRISAFANQAAPAHRFGLRSVP